MKYFSLPNIFYGILIASFIVLPFLSGGYGTSADEPIDYGHAESVLNYYLKGDTTCLNQPKSGLHYYGLSPQVIAHGTARIFGIDNVMTWRHFICSLFFCLGLVYTALLAKYIGGYRLGILTSIFYLFSPAIFNHGMNNLKDIPFAAAYIMTIYYTIRLIDAYPKMNYKFIVGLTLGLVLTISNRIGGVVLYPYILFYLGLKIVSDLGFFKLYKLKPYTKLFMILGAVFIVSYFLSLALWPYGLQAPFSNPLKALKLFTNYTIGIYQLFDGKYTLSTALPKYYLIKYIFITTPVIILLGFSIYFLRNIFSILKLQKIIPLFLLFAFAFPLCYIAYKESNVYGGWRHALFVYPSFIILASMGLDIFYPRFLQMKKEWLFYVLLIFTMAHPIRHFFANHPYQYIYFNEVMGGVAGGYGKYEMDYYFNSNREGAEWLKEFILKNHQNNKVKVAVNHSTICKFLENEKNITCTYVRYYERGGADWDYYLCVNSNIHPYQLKKKFWPPAQTVHTIDVDSKPVCAIIARKSKRDFEAGQALSAGDPNLAVNYFNEYLKVNPQSEWAWFQLAYIYAQNSNWQQAQVYIKECFKYHSEFLPAKALQGLLFFNTGRLAEAHPIFNNLIAERYDLGNSYKWSGQVYQQEKNYRKAINEYSNALGNNPNQKDLYNNVAECFRALGDNTNAKKYQAMAVK